MINSMTLEPYRLEPILSLVAEHGARVIGLCQSEEGMGRTLDTKLALADRLVEKVTGFGINIENLYIDPLIFPLSTDS